MPRCDTAPAVDGVCPFACRPKEQQDWRAVVVAGSVGRWGHQTLAIRTDEKTNVHCQNRHALYWY